MHLITTVNNALNNYCQQCISLQQYPLYQSKIQFFLYKQPLFIFGIYNLNNQALLISMTEKLAINVFENLFKLTYDPIYVDGKSSIKDQKNYYPTIYSAISYANFNSLIKINEGLYVQKFQLKIPNVRIQAAEPTTNAIIANQQFPSIIVDLPRAQDKVFLQSIKMAHLCQSGYNLIKNQSLEELREFSYRRYKIGNNINTNIIVRRGTLQVDQCRFSMASQKDFNNLTPLIVVQKQGTLIMNRSELKGAEGTIGIFCKGGTLIIKQSNFKDHGGIGVFVTGNKSTNITIKNSIFYNCTIGILLNGPFIGKIQSNLIKQSEIAGINILGGNNSRILSNQIMQCRNGVQIQNSCPILMKNIINNNYEIGVKMISSKNNQCWGLIKFNTIDQNQIGGLLIEGYKNKSQIFNNQIKYNGKYGLKVQNGSSPHILLNLVKNTLENGVYLCANTAAFLQKNIVCASLKCNIVIQGPGNIGNYIYNNIIEESRGQGIFVINGQRFMISNNIISKNHHGILSVTSVVDIFQNQIRDNNANGIFLIQDNNAQITQNQIKNNKKAGLVARDTSTGEIQDNIFQNNMIEILIENNSQNLDDVDQKNQIDQQGDIRIPRNYRCQLI